MKPRRIVRSDAQERDRLAEPKPPDGAMLDHSSACPVSGIENPLSMGMRAERRGNGVVASVTLGASFAGPPGIAHGGAVAGLLDDVMGFVLDSIERTAGYTASLTVSFKQPVPIGTEIHLHGQLQRREGRKLFIDATIEHDGDTLAEAEGLFIAVMPTT
jgi:acyl-coenzyme A thioesterase PaaI-like protein